MIWIAQLPTALFDISESKGYNASKLRIQNECFFGSYLLCVSVSSGLCLLCVGKDSGTEPRDA